MPRTGRSWPSAAAARIAGVKPQTLSYWVRSGLFSPSGLAGSGKGRRYKFTFRDLVALKAVAELRAQGISLQRLRRVRAALNKSGRVLERSTLVLIGDAVHLVEDAETLSDVLSGQFVSATVFAVAPVYHEVRTATEAEAQHQADVKQQRSVSAFKRHARAG